MHWFIVVTVEIKNSKCFVDKNALFSGHKVQR